MKTLYDIITEAKDGGKPAEETMIVLIPLQLIDDNPFQTRAAYAEEAIRELADSIRGLRDVRPETCGLIHVPPARVVDALEPGGPVDPRHALVTDESMETYRYQVAAGHSRLRAFRLLAGDDPEAWGAMPLDLGVLDDQAMADVAWAENQKRKDLSAIEEARALQAAMSRFNWTQEQVAERWKLARSTVANKLRLLGLPADLQEKVIAGEVGERAVRALLPALDAGADAAVKAGLATLSAGGTPDAVENDVTWALKRESLALSGDGALWPAEWPGERLGLKVPACQGCRHRRKIDKEWRCFDKSCFVRKGQVWNDYRVGLAIAAHQAEAGKPLVTYAKFSYDLVKFDDEAERQAFRKTCLPACRHGRLGLLSVWPSWMRGGNRGIKASKGEAWFVCDKRRCMQGLLGGGGASAEARAQKEKEDEARQQIELAIAQVLDELHQGDAARLHEFEILRTALIDRLKTSVHDEKLRRWLGEELEAENLTTPAGLWRAVLTWWLADSVGYYIWSGTKAEDTVGKRADALWAYLRPADVSSRRPPVGGETPAGAPESAEQIVDEVLRPLGALLGVQAPVAERWTCCVCGQAFGADVAVGLVLLDSDEHPQSGAYLCEACLRDTPAGGAALGVEGLAAAAHFCLQQGEWAMDVCVMGRPCLLCGQKKEGFGAGGWALREMPAGRAHDIQLCPECVAAGRAYQVTAWSPNGKNPNLAHHWTYQPDGSWSSACGQVQAAPWRPEADTSKHCATCARIVTAETG